MKGATMNRNRLAPTLLRLAAAGILIATACGGRGDDRAQSGGGLAADIVRIVVVDQQFACDCTLEKIEATTAALETVNGAAGLPVETLHMDIEEEAVAPYIAQRPILVIPALYFLDDEGQVVDFLQGEVSEEKIRIALGKTEMPEK